MESKVIGTVMPVLELNMQPNDKVFAESGELSWMSMAVQMQTGTSVGGQQGGLLGALGRAVAGGTLFMTEYTAVGGPGLLAFAAKLPGAIRRRRISPGRDRKSTRLNSSHSQISYAVFCLKKKKKYTT